jgi:hypothetical protein
MLFDNVFKCLVEPHAEKLAQVGLLLQHSWTWQLVEEQMMLCGSAFRCLVFPQLENPWQVGLLLQHSDTAHVELEQIIPAGVSFKCLVFPQLWCGDNKCWEGVELCKQNANNN